jgi:uncharacterized protein (TIGR02757 family)
LFFNNKGTEWLSSFYSIKAVFLAMPDLKAFLDRKVEQFNQPSFIEFDPISIPHQFSVRQDIEIMGFFAAVLAWGQRKTILNKCNELIGRMDGAPYDFIVGHQESDLKGLLGFKHRTFNDTDLLYFVSFLRHHFSHYQSLEEAFIPRPAKSEFRPEFLEAMEAPEIVLSSPACYRQEMAVGPFTIEKSLNHFRQYFFSLDDFPLRTRKHISSPLQKSTCKRLNMFLRWMVRTDDAGVDFGIWNKIRPSDLICPCDVHVDRVARKLGLISRKQTDWLTALELTEQLRMLDPEDPVKYDFALFGLGVEKEM